MNTFRRSGVRLQAMPQATGSGNDSGRAATDHLAADRLLVRLLWIDTLGHAWSGAPGGHPFVESGGAPLTALTLQFLRRATTTGHDHREVRARQARMKRRQRSQGRRATPATDAHR